MGDAESGTIFFANCNPGCIFCRNYDISHLVMPGLTEDSKSILKFIAEEILSDANVNVMWQYRPCFRAEEISPVNRYPNEREIEEVKNYAVKLKLARGL